MMSPMECPRFGEHLWDFATSFNLPAGVHPVTNLPLQRPSLLMTCQCGAQRHTWVSEPQNEPKPDDKWDPRRPS